MTRLGEGDLVVERKAEHRSFRVVVVYTDHYPKQLLVERLGSGTKYHARLDEVHRVMASFAGLVPS